MYLGFKFFVDYQSDRCDIDWHLKNIPPPQKKNNYPTTIVEVTFWYGSGYCYFSSVTFNMATKNSFFLHFHLRYFSKKKKVKEVTKQYQKASRFFLLILHDDRRIRIRVAVPRTNGSGSGSSKSMRILWIRLRIRNTVILPPTLSVVSRLAVAARPAPTSRSQSRMRSACPSSPCNQRYRSGYSYVKYLDVDVDPLIRKKQMQLTIFCKNLSFSIRLF